MTKTLRDEDTARKFIEKYGASGEKIKPEIKEILIEGGFEV